MTAGSGHERSRATELKVLLVEDNPGDARLVREMLKESQRRVELDAPDTAGDALECLRTRASSAILLDLQSARQRGPRHLPPGPRRSRASADRRPLRASMTRRWRARRSARARRTISSRARSKGRCSIGRSATPSSGTRRARRSAAARRCYRHLIEGSIQGVVDPAWRRHQARQPGAGLDARRRSPSTS